MRTLSALALLALAAGCGPSAPIVTGLASELPGSSWTLERVVLADGGVLRGDGARVTFAADGALSISSCNECGGRFTMADSVLSVAEPVACTRRACTNGQVELERYLMGESVVRRDGVYLVVEPAAGPAEQVLLVPAATGV